ncbi:flagellar associated protein [Trypanosoma theileri]|uniref:Flagellar associated protein n=1 Tax=Trypanosoma theileri TaxID=67003 RepID=A0A1X0P338_9TRYP|nr:flagellar associated protein [Trypanosoma theileri]ORC91366.1 flagellar associated protein [Trypanosoma theileri]
MSVAGTIQETNAPQGVSPSILSKTVDLFTATQQTTHEDEFESIPLSFLSTNRVVAVLEKAVERLELLSLLDTTAPDDNPSSGFLPALTGSTSTNPTANVDQSQTSGSTTPRKAALFVGRPEEMSRRTIREMNAALEVSARMQHGGRSTVADLVVEQQRLERRYGELLRQTEKTNPSPNEPELDKSCFAAVRDNENAAIMEELRQTSRKLREHNKALFVQLKDNPNDADNWKKVGNERSELIQLLQAVVRELTTGYAAPKQSTTTGTLTRTNSRYGRSADSESMATESKEGTLVMGKNRFGNTMQMKRVARGPAAPRIPLTSHYERFAKLISDEQSAQRWADELVLKEKELNQNVKQLQHDLKAERQRRERDVADRRQRVAALRRRLRDERRRVKDDGANVRAAVAAAAEAAGRKAREAAREVVEAARAAGREAVAETQAHADFTDHLRERTAAMDELAGLWDRKNQGEVKRVEARKIDVEQMRQQCAERLQRATAEKETELMLKAQRDAELQQQEAQRNAEETQANLEYEAVSVIQSAIKGMFTRHALTVLKKKNRRKRKVEKA